MSKFLVVGRDCDTRTDLARALTSAGYEVAECRRASEALQVTTEEDVTLILFDLQESDQNATTFLRVLRYASNVPVIVTTHDRGGRQVVEALNAGADDYLVKPIPARYLAARVGALLRRSTNSTERVRSADTVLVIGDLRIDLARRDARLGGSLLDLSRKEFDLLSHLARNRGRVVSKRELSQDVWSQPHVHTGRTIDVHASWLRRKLGETAANPRYLHTVRGVGFRMEAPE